MDESFNRLRQWMSEEEIESYTDPECELTDLLGLLLSRHKHTRGLIESLQKTVDPAFAKKLSCIDESIQVNHFFYQSALVQFHAGHKEYTRNICLLMNAIQKNSR
ncbi:hypothetical protein SAMN05444362_102388 [Dysgonomonas macrotermitis]|uniref:Uncharacterized protein n=2 Tax=Dysgonomonas macrotermitis TaxID=1346286 RepID=A0A1M4X331_9BACT|nr:hypothetical protein SAMN05444362_102388 [Dysgonomonas macrotermitis]